MSEILAFSLQEELPKPITDTLQELRGINKWQINIYGYFYFFGRAADQVLEKTIGFAVENFINHALVDLPAIIADPFDRPIQSAFAASLGIKAVNFNPTGDRLKAILLSIMWRLNEYAEISPLDSAGPEDSWEQTLVKAKQYIIRLAETSRKPSGSLILFRGIDHLPQAERKILHKQIVDPLLNLVNKNNEPICIVAESSVSDLTGHYDPPPGKLWGPDTFEFGDSPRSRSIGLTVRAD